jgi:hypothetical protein
LNSETPRQLALLNTAWGREARTVNNNALNSEKLADTGNSTTSYSVLVKVKPAKPEISGQWSGASRDLLLLGIRTAK